MVSAINNILFPTDFSENSNNALPFALEIAKRTGGTLHILHSIEEPYDFTPVIAEAKKSLGQRVKKLFNTMVEEIRKDKKYEDINIETCLQTGRALYTILEESENRNIDLIVMGAKGRTGLKKIFLGSTTAEMVQQSEVPVLAVPKEATNDDFKQIVFTTNYEDGDLEALQFVTGLAELFDSKITIFHASLESNLKTEIMFRGFKELVSETINYGKIEFEEAKSIPFFEAVIDDIGKRNISLLVMVHYEESFPPLPKQESKEMSYYTEVPLLVLSGSKLTNNETN